MEKDDDELLKAANDNFLQEITAHALESKCACKICYLLRKRHLKNLRKKLAERRE
jgi:hypothetical protein